MERLPVGDMEAHAKYQNQEKDTCPQICGKNGSSLLGWDAILTGVQAHTISKNK